MDKTLKVIARENQWLSYFGWGGDDSLRNQLIEESEKFDAAVRWVGQHMRKASAINDRCSSYGLKHTCEKMVGQYISNGTMIAAFLAHGYEFERVSPTSWSVRFNVSQYAVGEAEDIKNGNTNRGFVYFVQSENDVFKIGITNRDPEARIAALQVGSPVQLTLYKCVRTSTPKTLEKDLHKHFAAHRVNGEWFKITPEMIEDALWVCY
jgi:hypothetical protein